MISNEQEIWELETKFIVNLPADVTEIIPFPGWKKPAPMTKKDMEDLIEAFNKNPDMFKNWKS